MDVAGTLHEARTRAGLTQTDLARRAGTSQATVSAYECGRKVPSVATLSRLLSACGTELGPGPAVHRPTAEELASAADGLLEVIDLAAVLPTRHEPDLRFPRLPVSGAGR